MEKTIHNIRTAINKLLKQPMTPAIASTIETLTNCMQTLARTESDLRYMRREATNSSQVEESLDYE